MYVNLLDLAEQESEKMSQQRDVGYNCCNLLKLDILSFELDYASEFYCVIIPTTYAIANFRFMMKVLINEILERHFLELVRDAWAVIRLIRLSIRPVCESKNSENKTKSHGNVIYYVCEETPMEAIELNLSTLRGPIDIINRAIFGVDRFSDLWVTTYEGLNLRFFHRKWLFNTKNISLFDDIGIG